MASGIGNGTPVEEQIALVTGSMQPALAAGPMMGRKA